MESPGVSSLPIVLPWYDGNDDECVITEEKETETAEVEEEGSTVDASSLSGQPTIPEAKLIIGLSDRPQLEFKYIKALEAILQPKTSWPFCYRSRQLKALCRQYLNVEKNEVWFHVTQVLDYPIAYCIAQANEFDLWPKWHILCSKNVPIGPDNDPLRRISHWNKSLVMGLVKGEVLCDINRFINPSQGFYIEHVQSLDQSDPHYFPPTNKTLTRDDTWTSFMLIPLSRETTLVATVIKSALPTTLPHFVIKRLLAPLGSQFCHVYPKTLKTIAHPVKGKPWQERVAEDKSGLYKLINTITPLDERENRDCKGGYLNEELQSLLEMQCS
eukprot:GEMP01020720.1.p1 GENE.GEMP01020720.1~~GEMP01020720.1.p1  ORF type:complete len:329 (+),score=33.34 GEMP01020720.1:165-1151(+)